MPRRREPPQQLDLFISVPGDVPLRDDREAMSVPLVSLSKRKRTAPIHWTSADGSRWVEVSAPATTGLASIWDYDIVLWCISQLNAAVEAKQPTSPDIHAMPYDILRAIGRDTSGRAYDDLEGALDRLTGTLIRTNIRMQGNRLKDRFHLIERVRSKVDEATGKPKGIIISLPMWLYKAVVEDREVLAVSPAYFDISSGIGRWLYRLARRHAGKQATGWRFTVKELHRRSGSTQRLGDFARDLRRAVAAGVPEYRFDWIDGQHGDEVLHMQRDPAKVGPPQRRDLRRMTLPR